MPRAVVPLLLPLLSSLLVVFSLPGWNRGQLAWISLVPLLLFPARSSFSKGFGAGFLAHLGTLYWIYPTCRAAGVAVPAALFAVAALAAYCACYWGAFAAALPRFERLPAWLRPFAAAALWTALEFLRAHFLTGFPWLPLAYSQWNVPQHLPLAALGGFYAVTFMLVLFNGMAALFLSAVIGRRWKSLVPAAPAAAALVGLVAVSVFLSRGRRPPEGPAVSVSLVQGNVDQYKKWDRAYEEEIADVYSRLTRESVPADLVVWPETSVPGWLPNDPRWVRWVTDLSRDVQTPILVGAVTREDGGDYNAAFLVHPSSGIVARYRKRHMVPFGETVPFQSLLGRWVPVLGELGRFEGSGDWTVFALEGGAPFAANICFESLFPGVVRGFVRRGAGFSVNVTNDGWFLDTSAAEQHFAAAPFRAVETGAWVVCATNTGVSAFVDPAGRVAARIKRGAPGVLKGVVVPDVRGTFYARHGDAFAWLCVLFSAFSLTLGWRAGRIPA